MTLEATLSAAQLAAMRAVADTAEPDTAYVYRRTHVTDSAGGFTVTEALAATLDVRVDAPSSTVLELFAQHIGERKAFVLNVTYNADIQAGDRVLVGSTYYEILGTYSEPRSWEITRQAIGVVTS